MNDPASTNPRFLAAPSTDLVAGLVSSYAVSMDGDRTTFAPLPKPPTRAIWVTLGVGMCAGLAVASLPVLFPAGTRVPGRPVVIAALILAWFLLVAGAVIGLHFHVQRVGHAKGPYLRSDAKEGVVELPRSGVRVNLADVRGVIGLWGWPGPQSGEQVLRTQIALEADGADGTSRHLVSHNIPHINRLSEIGYALAGRLGVPYTEVNVVEDSPL